MGTLIAILRGINVGGHRKLPMADLRELLGAMKCTNVRTYIQSGNAVFEYSGKDPAALAQRIEQRIKDRFGFDVPVIVRSVKEMKQVVVANPYMKDKRIDVDELHVTFLAEAPKSPMIPEHNYAPDSFVLTKKEVYLHCPDGYGNTKLNNTFFENKLKVSCTTRNWRTVNELVRMGEEG